MSEKSGSLKTVQKVREIQERMAQQELSNIQCLREKENLELDKMNTDRQLALEDSSRIVKRKAHDLQADRAFLFRLSEQISRQREKVLELERTEDRKRDEVADKSKKKKMIEILREQREALEEKEREKKEQELIDVLAQRDRTGENA